MKVIKIICILLLVTVTGCTFSSTPPEGPITLEKGTSREFTIALSPLIQKISSSQWFINTIPLPDETGLSYVFQANSPGAFTIEFRVEFKYCPVVYAFSWPVTVKSPDVEVPAATKCADILIAGLACSTNMICSDTAAADSIISQSPPAGDEAPPGSTVTLTISSGPCPVIVPQAESCADIEDAGLICQSISICDNTLAAGAAIHQSPAAGIQVPPDSTVILSISSGPCPVTVPEAESCADIEDAGLICETYSTCNNTVAEGAVIRQNPAAGTQVEFGSRVILIMSVGPCIQLNAPQNVQATDVEIDPSYNPMLNNNLDNRTEITWDAVEHADCYEIYRSDNATAEYTLLGTCTAAFYSDNQTDNLTIPGLPKANTAQGIDANEAILRPIFNDFKNFKYYKVRACSTNPKYTPSELSDSDQGRMDYTVNEFATMVMLMEALPLTRLYVMDTNLLNGIDQTYYDTCPGGGYVNGVIEFDHVFFDNYAPVDLTYYNYTDSLDYDNESKSVMCGGTRRLIANGLISDILNAPWTTLKANGTLEGLVALTGDFAGEFDDISLPVVNNDIKGGTCTIRYNGHEAYGYPFEPL